jgi:hypothetical protein
MATATKTDWGKVYAEAHKAGLEAVERATPTPMVVYETHGLTDIPKEGGKSWYVPSGVCGFAWVNIRPATSSFVKYLKSKGIGRLDSYYGGWTIWVGGLFPDFREQSVEYKEAYARAFASVLKEHGIKAYAHSRLD